MPRPRLLIFFILISAIQFYFLYSFYASKPRQMGEHKQKYEAHARYIKYNYAPTKCQYESCNKAKPDALNVHIVAHSHDDVGWLKTVQQYYDGSNNGTQFANVRRIITSVVEALQDNPHRRFIQVETFFFHKWWMEQDEKTQRIVHKLVEDGRLEFTGGAWSMNDEAAADFHSIIDQFTFGLNFLNATFGSCGRPKIGWQIDPFGHSSEMASIFAQMGYDGWFFPRMDYKDKQHRKEQKRLEVMWQGSRSLGDESNIFTSIMYDHYNSPRGFCFDITCKDPQIQPDENQPGYNYKTKVDRFTNVITEGARYYQTNNLLITMGGDFNYMDAMTYYESLDALIYGFELWPKTFKDKPINVFYSTPACYTKAVNDIVNEQKIELPKEVNDFFPYVTDSQTYWTGYFSSRPTSKKTTREALNLLQIHKQLAVFDRQVNASELFGLQNAVGIMQHHDAVTGTEKQHVANDYAKILHEAFLESGDKINAHISQLLAKAYRQPVLLDLRQCLLKNVTICPESKGDQFTIVLYNPSTFEVRHPARVPVNSLDYVVTSPNGRTVNYQLVPSVFQGQGVTTAYEMTFIADLPPMGIKVYFVQKATFATFLLKEDVSEEKYRLGGQLTSAKLDPNTGLLDSVNIMGIERKMRQELMFYYSQQRSGRNSGAYVFRNNGDAEPIGQDGVVDIVTYKGDIFDEVHQVYGDWAKQVIRVYKDPYLADNIEFDWIIGPIPVKDERGKEVISRFTSDLDTGEDFYTDANGREFMHRVRDKHPDPYVSVTEPVAGNYYPVTSALAIGDGKVRMAVLTDRSQGGSSLKSGQIELMIHRRTLKDDYWGVNEVLNETEHGVGLKARGRHFLTLSSQEDRRFEEALANKIAFNPWMFFDSSTKREDFEQEFNLEFVGIKENMPAMIRVLTLEPLQGEKNKVMLRLENFFDADTGATQTVNVKNLFTIFEIVSLEEMNLSGNARKHQDRRLNWSNYNLSNERETTGSTGTTIVTLKPMQIKTFIAKVNYH